MKLFLSHLRDIAIAGFFALLPVYILFLVIAKAWKSLQSVGAGIAGIFGMKPILGVGSSTIFTGLLVIAVWIVCGLLVRFTFKLWSPPFVVGKSKRFFNRMMEVRSRCSTKLVFA